MKKYTVFGELFNVAYNEKFEGRAPRKTVEVDFESLQRQLNEQSISVRLMETIEGGSDVSKDAVKVS